MYQRNIKLRGNFDERDKLGQKFETAFYAKPDLRSVRPPEEPKEPAPAALDLEALVEQLRKSPELANTLARCSRQHPAANESKKSN